MMQNPFYQYNLAAENLHEIEALRIDRDREVAICRDAIVKSLHNVLLYGTRGVGKTFLLRLVEKAVTDHDPSVFPCLTNIASLIEYRIADDVGAFPRAVLLQLCAFLWTDVLNRSYLDLRDALDETGQEIHRRPKDEVTIRRIYRHLMLLERSARSAMFNTVGFSAGVKGEKKEEAGQQMRHSNVLPFEFAEFAHELVANVLKPRDKSRLVVLCDEANQMPIFRQEEILERYLELFSSKRVQFVFVAGMVPWDTKAFLPSCFETCLELKGFGDKSCVEELITRAQPKIPFTGEAIDVLFEAYSGHPRYTVTACGMAYDQAAESNAPEISAAILLRVINRLDEERKAHEEMMRRELEDRGS